MIFSPSLGSDLGARIRRERLAQRPLRLELLRRPQLLRWAFRLPGRHELSPFFGSARHAQHGSGGSKFSLLSGLFISTFFAFLSFFVAFFAFFVAMVLSPSVRITSLSGGSATTSRYAKCAGRSALLDRVAGARECLYKRLGGRELFGFVELLGWLSCFLGCHDGFSFRSAYGAICAPILARSGAQFYLPALYGLGARGRPSAGATRREQVLTLSI